VFQMLVQVGIFPNGVFPRFLFRSSGLLVIAAALGAQTLTRRVLPSLLRRTAPAVLGLLLVAGLVISLGTKKNHLWDWLHGSSFEVMQYPPDLEALREATSDHPPFRVVSITTFRRGFRHEGMAVFANGFETADGYVNLYSARYKQFWDAVLAKIETSKATQAVYLAAPPGLTGKMCAPQPIKTCVIDFEQFYDLELLSLANVKYIISPLEINTPDLELLPSPWRREILDFEDRKQREKWLGVLDGRPTMHTALFIYENKRALPRFFLTHGIKVFRDQKTLIEAMSNASVRKLRESVFVEQKDASKFGLAESSGKLDPLQVVEVAHYGGDLINLETNGETASTLVITNNFSPFWRACVDGRSVSLFPVYHTFSGLSLPPGTHHVTLFYDPPYRFTAPPECK